MTETFPLRPPMAPPRTQRPPRRLCACAGGVGGKAEAACACAGMRAAGRKQGAPAQKGGRWEGRAPAHARRRGE